MMDCSIIEHMKYVKEKWELSYIIRENRLKRNILVCQRKKYLNQRKIEIRNGCMKYKCIQRAFNCSKTVIETLEQDVSHVQRQQQKHQKNISEHTFNLLQCFQCCFQQLKAYFVQQFFMIPKTFFQVSSSLRHYMPSSVHLKGKTKFHCNFGSLGLDCLYIIFHVAAAVIYLLHYFVQDYHFIARARAVLVLSISFIFMILVLYLGVQC